MMKKKLEHDGREEDNAEREDIKNKRGAEEGRGEKKRKEIFWNLREESESVKRKKKNPPQCLVCFIWGFLKDDILACVETWD